MEQKPKYGTWIRKKKIIILAIVSFLSFCFSAFSFFNLVFLVFLIPSFLFLYIVYIVSYTYYQFSSNGGDYQNKIHQLIVDRVTCSGNILDIGCGNGNLSIKIAKKFNNSNIIGLDYWGKEWEYALNQCVANTELENIKNIEFKKGSASNLEFANECFDCIVSCLTFHEVKYVIEKEKCIIEALRTLKPGGTFVFFDLFDDTKYYPGFDLVVKSFEISSCTITENKNIKELMDLPYPLNNKNSLRYARLIYGKK
jgi:ubiquinone/menaquinone biosynthesis C-methylase UbiE